MGGSIATVTVLPTTSRQVVVAASIAAVIELVVLRVATRTAVFIPGISERIGAVEAIGELGRLVYSVSLVLVVAGLVSLAVAAMRVSTTAGRVLAVALLGFAAAALAARLGWVPRAAPDLAALAAVGLVGIMARHWRRPAALAVLAFTGAFVLAGIDGIWRNLAGQAAIPGSHGILLSVAEWLVVGAAVASLAAHPRIARGPLAVGVVLGAVTVVALVAAPSTSRTLLLWTSGLPGSAGPLAYGVVGLALGVTTASAVRIGALTTAAGLLLLAAGGIGLQNTYQSGLVVAGMAALALCHGLDDRRWAWIAAPRWPGDLAGDGVSADGGRYPISSIGPPPSLACDAGAFHWSHATRPVGSTKMRRESPARSHPPA